MKTFVWVTTQFTGFHRWKDAPGDVSFLREYHRHIFHIKLGKEVIHADRDIEFFQLKSIIESYVTMRFANQQFDYSCEMIAAHLLEQFGAAFVEVSEDNENGATVINKKQTQNNIPTPVKSPATEVKSKCFIGNEAEGPYVGCRVLFVPGTCSKKEFYSAIKKVNPQIDRIYYGAGNDRTISTDLLLEIKEWCSVNKKVLDIEITIEDLWKIPDDVVVILFVSSKNEMEHILNHECIDKRVSFLKYIDNNVIIWYDISCGKEYRTALTDKLFTFDEYI